MTCCRKLFLSVFLTFVSLSAGAFDDFPYFFSLNNENDGLSHNGVRGLLQDRRGYVWIGTQMGLDRWDGTRIRIFSRNQLPSPYIFTLNEDIRGNVWIGTGRGIAFYDYEQDRIVRPCFEDGSTLNVAIYSITCNSQGEVWFDARMGELFSYNYEDGFIRRRDIGLGHRTIKYIAFNSDDDLVISSYLDYIYIYRPKENKTENIELLEGGGLIRDDEVFTPVFNTRFHSIFYVSTKRSGVVEVNTKTKTARSLFGWTPLQKPNDLALYDNRYLICATTSGVVYYDILTGNKKTWLHIDDDEHSLADSYVLRVMVDRGGGVWAGTAQSGVSYTCPEFDCFRRLSRTADGTSLNGCNTRGICEDKYGDIWITTERQGLLKYERSTQLLKAVPRPEIPVFLTAILADGDYLWIGTQYGVLRYSLLNGRVKKYEIFGRGPFSHDNRVIAFFKSSSGQVYVTVAASTMLYDRRKDVFNVIPNAGVRAYESMTEDPGGTIWMGSYSQGLHSMDSHDDYAMKTWPQCPQSMISSVITGPDGSVWVVGYDAILSRYNAASGGFDTFTPDEYPILPDASYVSACTDRENHLWVGSTAGLVEFNPASGAGRRYTCRHGLLDDYFSKAALRLSSGELAFGSRDGVVIFDPAVVSANRAPERVDIVSMSTGEGKMEFAGNVNNKTQIVLSSPHTHFSMQFSVPCSRLFTDAYCFLEGHDKEPQDISSSLSVSYFGLEPGRYTMKLTSHPDVEIVVEPGFWRSLYGMGLILVAVITLILAVTGAVMVIEHRRQASRIAAIEREKEKELLDSKMHFMSNVVHEIKTPLTPMRSSLGRIASSPALGDEDRANLGIVMQGTSYLDKLSKDLLRFITISESDYVLELRPIDLLMRISSVCFKYSATMEERGIKLSFVHDIDTALVNANETALDIILNNLLDNALKYSKTYVEVRAGIDGEDSDVAVYVKNDGRKVPVSRRLDIFKPFVTFGYNPSPPDQSFGLGLPQARRLAELHEGSLDITDSPDTEFLLRLPLFRQESAPSPSVLPGLDNGKKNILIVEDNEYLSKFLSDELSSEYNVIAVDNAAGANDVLSDTGINLILLDLNLPGMSGLEFCRRLKLNPSLKHIKVVVMSATTSEKAKIDSLDSGASLFIEKPFTIEYLRAVFRRMMSGEGKSAEGDIVNSDFKLDERDRNFLRKLDSIVEEHLDDESFSVQQLEEALFVSHATLNRRMAALLQATPLDYIRTKRLNAAMAMLKERKGNITEIAYATGFSSLSYFSRSFKNYFGKSPMDIMKQK